MPTHTSASSALVLSSRLLATSWQRPLKGVLLSWNLCGLGGWFVILMAYTMLASSVQARVVPQYLRSVPESSYRIHSHTHHHHHHHHHKHHQQQQQQQRLERHHQYASPQSQKDTSQAHSGIWFNLAIPSTRDILHHPPTQGPATTTLAPQPDLSRLVIHSIQTTSQPAIDDTPLYDSSTEEEEEERRLELDLEEHLRQTLHRQARQAPNLCVKDETGKTETICQTCSEITNNPGGHHDCCRNIESAFSWCKRLYDFKRRFGG